MGFVDLDASAATDTYGSVLALSVLLYCWAKIIVLQFNPLILSGLFYHNSLDWSISNRKVSC